LEPDRARELLERERERVLRELGDLRSSQAGEGELSSIDQHTADAGSQLFDAERDRSMIERLEGDLEAIKRARKRLDDGTYGVSVDSGNPIPDERLEALPWAERTVDEQSRYEAFRRNG
jgi:DnaK suppressor protein